MERLQAAIEKARAQRKAAPPADTPRRRVEPAAAPEPGESRTLWAGLEPLRVKPELLHRRRVVAVQGGQAAAPYDMLRTRMLQQAQSHGWKRIAIVSPHSACGKSTTAANLAFSLARQRGVRSMVLDFDLRRAGLTRLLGLSEAAGMAAVLEGRADFADHARRQGDNVAFGLGAAGTASPSEILQSSQTREILAGIEEAYRPDIVLFDMPPLMASDDNFGFLQNVDAALMLVAAEKTTMTQIDVAERQVAELTSVMGVILNKCRYTDGAYGYEHGYY